MQVAHPHWPVRLPPHFIPVRRTTIRLYTMGQPRVGDAAYATLVESLFHERFRIVNTADIVPHLPPSKVWAQHGCRHAVFVVAVQQRCRTAAVDANTNPACNSCSLDGDVPVTTLLPPPWFPHYSKTCKM